ncbi:hypothetical protein H2198_008499 [Neophaeococcomyces mojaviensis]|uniref:Uncharacterized protein n=1 Tax=Neophaeococcomyces mojaviensis TaxID=3383035 RepID=A0ACC2ZX75_9EURO|nr:hypothetical protein H2198_008499 [Knufia sp. JES_112]
MTSTKPVTFVLVPGSFVTPAENDKLAAALEQKGYTVNHIELLTANDGTRQPPATMADDTTHIRSEISSILDNDNRNVVLVLHSYAGIPGNNALSGLNTADRAAAGKDTSVVGILFIGSFLPMAGESLRDILTSDLAPGEHIQEPYKSGMPGEYLPAIPAEFAPFVFNDLVDQAEVAKYHGLMVRHASDSYGAKATYTAWKDIHSVYMIPERDVILPVVVQEAMYERAISEGGKVKRVFVEGVGHCVNISRPEVVVKELEAITGL